MFCVKLLIVVDIPFIPDLDPLFVGGFHVTVYEPVLSCEKRNVIDVVVDDILVGGFAFPGTIS